MYISLQTFTSKHGHFYEEGQEITTLTFLRLSVEDQVKFRKKADPYWDDAPVAAQPSDSSGSVYSDSGFSGDTTIPDSAPTFGGFGGGDGGGGGAGGSWGGDSGSSDSSSSSSDYSSSSDSSSSSSDYSSSSDSSSSFDSSSSYDSGSGDSSF